MASSQNLHLVIDNMTIINEPLNLACEIFVEVEHINPYQLCVKLFITLNSDIAEPRGYT
jgi:hypothetical protein